jgi:thiol-disulfide isomerase/thioredoxin
MMSFKIFAFWFMLGIHFLANCSPVVASGNCKVSLGGPAPSLYGKDLSGQDVDLDSLRGKWVFIDFWASWCKPCMKELPGVVNLHNDLGNRGDFTVMSIALDDPSTLKTLKEVRTKYQVDYPVVYDNAGWSNPHVRDWCVEAIPTTFLIDPSGRVVERDLSPTQVRSYISRIPPAPKIPEVSFDSQRTNQVTTEVPMPSGFNAKHRVLRDSPTSGKRGYRDLQISLPSPVLGDSVRYLLVVQGDDGNSTSTRIRYDLEFTGAVQRNDFPFSVAIREASGLRSERLKSGEKSVLTGSAVDFFPGAQISHFVAENRLLFTIPLPPGLRAASYSVSRFNDVSESFDATLAAEISL